jgi:hypothetical protein
VQSRVRVRLRGRLMDIGPVRVPLGVGPQHTQGEHVLEIVGRPPRAGALEPTVNDVPMGALDLARADGQVRRQRPLIVQAAGPVGEIPDTRADGRGLVGHVVQFHRRAERVEQVGQRFALSQVFFSDSQAAGSRAATTAAAAAR